VLDVLDTIIHSDQKGFIPGRSIHHQIRLVHDLQDLCTLDDSEGLAAFLDFEKAYDRVDHGYLRDVLLAYNFGPGFRTWVDLLYQDTRASLNLNGWMQEPLRPGRGVKQGDPLSVVLFTLCVEPLGNLLRGRPELGIPVGDTTTVTGAYFADDSTLFPRNRDALAVQLGLVDEYCRGSGARLNRIKSQLLTLNRNAEALEIIGLGVVTTSITYLGITIGPAVTLSAIERTLEDKLTAALNRWRYRARTLYGRLLLANSVVLSVLWHFTPHFDFSKSTIERWQRMVANYVLYGTPPDTKRKLHLISRELHALPKTDGGIQIPQIQATILRQRFNMLQDLIRVNTSSPEQWAIVAGKLFARALGPVCTTEGSEWLWTRPSEWPKSATRLLPSRWVSSWAAWSAIDWPNDATDLGPWATSVRATNSSLWLSIRSPPERAGRALYLTAPLSLRPLCQALATAGFQSLLYGVRGVARVPRVLCLSVPKYPLHRLQSTRFPTLHTDDTLRSPIAISDSYHSRRPTPGPAHPTARPPGPRPVDLLPTPPKDELPSSALTINAHHSQTPPAR
jgi:hypothetical protein